jgi:hypothetical protein
MAFSNGYDYRQRVTLTTGSLTDYVSATENGIKLNIGSGTTSGQNVYIDTGKVQSSFIDVLITDSSSVAIPFEIVPTLRLPAISAVVIWEKASLANGDELYVYYGKSDATYQGVDVGIVEAFNDYSLPITDKTDQYDGALPTVRYIGGDTTEIANANGFSFFCYTEEENAGENPRIYGAKVCEFTKRVVEKRFIDFAVQNDESHNHGVLHIDPSGYIQFFSSGYDGAGGTGPRHATSATVYSLDFGTITTITQGLVNNGMYYLEPFNMPNDDILLFGRDLSYYYLLSTDGGSTWATALEVAQEDNPVTTNSRVYGYPTQKANGDILLPFGFSDASGGFEAIHFFQMGATSRTWTSGNGSAITLPATSGDASEIATTSGYNPGTQGATLDGSGNPVFYYVNNGFTGTELGIYRFNGSTWDKHVLFTGGSTGQYFGGSVLIDDLSGATAKIHYIIGNEISAGRVDWEKYTSTSYGGSLTAVPSENVITNQGNVRGISFYEHITLPVNPTHFLFTDADTPNTYFTDTDAPTYTDNLNTSAATKLLGGGRLVVAADTVANKWLMKPVTAVSSPVFEYQIKHYDILSTNKCWFAAIGGHGAAQDFNASGADCTTMRMGTGSGETGLQIRTENRIAGTATLSAYYDGSAASSPNTINQETLYYGRVQWTGSQVISASYDDSEFDTARGTATVSGAQASFPFIGLAAAVSGSAVSEGVTYEVTGLRYYNKQTAPTYSSWLAEESQASTLNITVTNTPDGTYKTIITNPSDDSVVFAGNLAYSSNSATTGSLSLAVSTALTGFVIDNEATHVNGAVITGTTV